MSWRQIGHQEAGPFQANNLKICELCGALNLAKNKECFVCGWRGKFDRRVEVVQLAMEVMIRRHGRLELQMISSPSALHAATSSSRFARFRSLCDRIMDWFFGKNE